MASQIEIYLGVPSPAWVERMERLPKPLSSGAGWAILSSFKPRIHPLSLPDFPWPDHVVPRWAGPGEEPPDDTSRCLAAINPNPNTVAFNRFRQGRRKNKDIAVNLCEVSYQSIRRNPRAELADDDGVVHGEALPKGIVPSLSAEKMTNAERDLADLIGRYQAGQFHSLKLMLTDGKHEAVSPNGNFKPLLLDDLGNPLVAVWTPSRQFERWYLIPEGCPWELLLSWLVKSALPEHLPERISGQDDTGDELRTKVEMDAEREFREFVETSKREGGRLKEAIRLAREAANLIRQPLLFEGGDSLVLAVQTVFESLEFSVENLDKTFGFGASADLLISQGHAKWLIEVRSSSGVPKEDSVSDLRKHLHTWESLGGSEPLRGGVLILNHENQKKPSLRSGPPYYTRPGFADSLDVVVIGSITLFRWWREKDSAALLNALEGTPAQH